MIELRPSPFKPGKGISSSQQQFYHIYKDGKIVDRTLYTKYGYTGDKNKNILVLNKRTIEEIKPNILDSCRRGHHRYPKYHMEESIVVVSGETGKIIFDTGNSYCFDGTPCVISDYMFMYKNTLYDNKGHIIKKFSSCIETVENNNVFIVKDGTRFSKDSDIYVFNKTGKLLNLY